MPQYIVRVREPRIGTPVETLRMSLKDEPVTTSEMASVLASRAMRRLYGPGMMFHIRDFRQNGAYLVGRRCWCPRKGDAALAFDGPQLVITITKG